jgi:threonyl-tRNA synthetase
MYFASPADVDKNSAEDLKHSMVKAMNCPSHALIFGSTRHSYRELPLRIADFGRLHRYERAGVVHGLARVRSFSQDDAHIFCTHEQLQSEITNFMNLLNEIYKTFGFTEYTVYFSTRPEKRMGADEVWDQSEQALESALKNLNLKYKINAGDGAFYGPKLDIMVSDSIGRAWQLGTLQCDFNMANRFELEYIGEDNKPHKPVVLHRAILGSLERFFAVYVEHCAGNFPVWLSPTQVKIINITDAQENFAQELQKKLITLGVRAEADLRNEKLGYKIREAQLQKVPYMVILGDKEVANQSISLRLKNGKEIKDLKIDEFINKLTTEILTRAQESSFT